MSSDRIFESKKAHRRLHDLKRLFRNSVAPRLSETMRLAAYCKSLRCDMAPLEGMVFKLAETQDELESCFRLLHDAYVEAGFMKPDPSGLRVTPYHALPTTSTLMCVYNGEVAGTVSLIGDNRIGFPLQKIFNLQAVRDAGGKLTEVSSLAIAPKYRRASGRILLPLIKFMYTYARDYFDTRHLVIAVNPRHIGFYETVLCFRRLKQAVIPSYDFVNGASAAGATLDLMLIPELLRHKYANFPPEKSLSTYFLETSLPFLQYPTKRYYTTTDPVMTPALLDYFFNQKTHLFQSLDQQSISVLHDVYESEQYKAILPTSISRSPQLRTRSHKRFPIMCPCTVLITAASKNKPLAAILTQCSANSARVFSKTPFPLDASGTLNVHLGPGDHALLSFTAIRYSTKTRNVAILRIDQAGEAWTQFVLALQSAETYRDLAAKTRVSA